MKIFENIIGQDGVIDALKKVSVSGKVHHAYLFIGPPSVGKRTVAQSFACVLNCPAGGCGECETCQRIMRGVEQDVLYIQPETNFFTISQVRKVIQEASLKPWSLNYKVIILDEVERMTTQAANAFLRALEEPPSFKVLYILLTSDYEAVLETVRSRCQPVHFHRLSDDQMVQYLVDTAGYLESAAQDFIKMAGRTFDSPLQAAVDNERLKLRRTVIDTLTKLPSSNGAELLELASALETKLAQAIEKKGELTKQEGELVIGEIKDKTLRTRIKNRLEEQRKNEVRRFARTFGCDVFNITLTWYFDIVQLACGSNDTLINTDELERLRRAAQHYSADGAVRVLAKVRALAPFVNYNVNKRLLTEILFLKIAKVR